MENKRTIKIPLEINNREVTVPAGSTILDAAAKLNIHIPTMCYLKDHEPFTSCMICVVHDMGSDRLVPACSMPAEPGMRIETDNENVRNARKDTLDFLLSEHVGDCEAPCRLGCPANMDIPQMIRQIKEKDFAGAGETIKRNIALPAVLGRICPAPCEKVCNRKFFDAPVSICLLKRFAADIDLAREFPYRPEVKNKTGKKVALVGGGPTGLSAAYYLQQEGHDCFIYDMGPQSGGMLRYGVPDEKLPQSVLDDDIRQITESGARFYNGVALGKDIQWDELKKEYDAVVIATGTMDEPGLFDNTGIELSNRGIVINKQTFETTVPGIFAGGNAVGESRMAVRACAHGKGIAYSVNQFLKNEPVTPPPRRFNSRMGKPQEDEVKEFLPPAARGPAARGAYKKTAPKFRDPAKLFVKGFSEPEAIRESSRCFNCDCGKPDACKLRQYAEEYHANQRRFKLGTRKKFERIIQHDLVVYEPGKCIKCGICVRLTKDAGETFGMTFVNRGIDARVQPPFNEPLSEALKETAEKCIDACPTGALSRKNHEQI
ncbi:MAG: FAD-dependent oxidoreductase [bacterium]|nr:FAD-dependent oxidoreductase [bacterium]